MLWWRTQRGGSAAVPSKDAFAYHYLASIPTLCLIRDIFIHFFMILLKLVTVYECMGLS